MVKILSPESPEIRVHVGDESVKFHAGVAEVSDEVAEALLAIEWLALERAGDEPADEPVSADGRSENGNPVSADLLVEPAKRKPGRPRKSDSAE